MDEALGKVTSLITVGAILNMAWNPNIVKHERFTRPIRPEIRWYNLWTRYDYGAAGAIDATSRDWIDEATLADYRVNNLGSLALDHTEYWGNREQVLAILLEELSGRDERSDFWRGSSERGNGEWYYRSEQTWKDFDMRREAIAKLGTTSLPLLTTMLLWPFFALWVIVAGGYWIASLLFSTIALPVLPLGIAGAVIAGPTALALVYHLLKWKQWDTWFAARRLERDREFKEWRLRQREAQAGQPGA